MDECPTPQAPATTTLVEGVFCSVDFFSHGDITDQLLVELGVHASNFSVEFSFSRDQTTKIADSVLHTRALSGQQTCWSCWEHFATGRAAVFHFSLSKQILRKGASGGARGRVVVEPNPYPSRTASRWPGWMCSGWHSIVWKSQCSLLVTFNQGDEIDSFLLLLFSECGVKDRWP